MSKKSWGQFFTSNQELQRDIITLLPEGSKKNCRILEPSAGIGHLVKLLEDQKYKRITAIDIDGSLDGRKLSKTKIQHQDFLSYQSPIKFDLILTNPPYVSHRLIKETLKTLDWKSRLPATNLYGYFIEKMFQHIRPNGILILVLPKEFFNVTRLSRLREDMYKKGTITDVFDYEERKMFDDADILTIIIKYHLGNLAHKTRYKNTLTTENLNECLIGSNYIFREGEKEIKRLGEIFNIKVGLVSGANKIFETPTNHNFTTRYLIDIISSGNKVKKYIFTGKDSLSKIKKNDDVLYAYLQSHKKKLIERKIREFNEQNWCEWGAIRNLDVMVSYPQYGCIYVTMKTRQLSPFFIGQNMFYDGSVLCLIPKEKVDLKEWVKRLNRDIEKFDRQGLRVNGRYLLTQQNLSNYIYL